MMYSKKNTLLAELEDIGQLISTVDFGLTPAPRPGPAPVFTGSGGAGPITLQPPGFFDPLTGQFMAVQPGVAVGVQAPPFAPAAPIPKPMPKPIAPSAGLIEVTKSSISGIQKQIDFLKSQKESVTEAIKKAEAELNNKIKAIKQQAPKEAQVKLITDATAKASQKISSGSAAMQAINAAEAQAKKRMDDLIDTYNEERMARIRQEQAYTESLATGKSVAQVAASYDPEFQASMHPEYWKTKGKSEIEAMRPGTPGLNITQIMTGIDIYRKFSPMISEAKGRVSGALERLSYAGGEAKSALKRGLLDLSFKAEEGSKWFQEKKEIIGKAVSALDEIKKGWDKSGGFLIGDKSRPVDKNSAVDLANQVTIRGLILQGKQSFSDILGSSQDLESLARKEIATKLKHDLSKMAGQINEARSEALSPWKTDGERAMAGQRLYDLISGDMQKKFYSTIMEHGTAVKSAIESAKSPEQKKQALQQVAKKREISEQTEKIEALQAQLQKAQKPGRYVGAEEDVGASMQVGLLQQKIRDAQKKLQELSR